MEPILTNALREETLNTQNLRAHYSRFLAPGRILLTGHSHQAWPNVAAQAHQEAFDDAANFVDDKWERAFAKAQRLREVIASRIQAHPDEIVLGSNNHELALRFLSCLPWKKRRHIVTTSGEFHSVYRQLARLQEEGVEVTYVETAPLSTLSERLAKAVRQDTAAVIASTVLFESASVVPNLKAAVERAHASGAAVLLDAYHGFSAMPVRMADYGEAPVFLMAGGYKYAQWGEACCFMRVPRGCEFRPVVTGWFADFEHLDEPRKSGPVFYSQLPYERFAGSTYDPVSHYRAVAVSEFFESQNMSMEALRKLSLQQTQRLMEGLERFDILTPKEPELRGGFVSLRIPNAAQIVQSLRRKNVFVDSRGDILRLGPAPYVTLDEIDAALAALNEALAEQRSQS